jgi:hypothetical protein
LLQKFLAGDADEPLAVNFAENHAAGTALELSENILKKIGHERQNGSAPLP